MKNILLLIENGVIYKNKIEQWKVNFFNAPCVEVKPQETLVIADNEGRRRYGRAIKDFEAVIGYGLDYSGNERYIIDNFDEIEYDYLERIFCRLTKRDVVIAVTERLIIREQRISDLESMYELYRQPSVAANVEPLYEYEEEKAFSKAYIDNMYGFYGYGLWLVFLKERPGVLVGRAGLSHRNIDGKESVELGYIIDDRYQRSGFGRECCTAILSVAKDIFGDEYMKKEGIFICCNKDNLPSNNLAAKLKFKVYGKDGDNVIWRYQMRM